MIYKKFFKENLKLLDLSKHAGISSFTKPFMKYRQKKFKQKSSILLKMKIDRKKDFVLFTFVSTPTHDKEKHFITHPKSMKLKPSDEYDQQIKILDFFKLIKTHPDIKRLKKFSIDDIKEVLKLANIQVWCDCPSNWYQGFSYYLTQEFNASIHRNDIQPKVWNKKHNDGDGLICKHLDLIFSNIKFFINPMASMILKYIKEN